MLVYFTIKKNHSKYAKRNKSEYNCKFKLGTLIKCYNKDVEEKKNDFLKEYPMIENNMIL